jgi:hypothetical protein
MYQIDDRFGRSELRKIGAFGGTYTNRRGSIRRLQYIYNWWIYFFKENAEVPKRRNPSLL